MRPKPKKSLGQNFLQDPNIRRKIVATCGFTSQDIVLEIGPGQAAMTSLIAPHVKKLIAVEVDRALSSELTVQFQDNPSVTIVSADILKYDLSQISLAQSHKIKVFGNIPYYITSPIIEHLFAYRDKISVIYLTVQKEFGQRIVAQPGSEHYGSFSCFVQYYTIPTIEFTIKRTCFFPAPNVDSCFLKLEMRTRPPVSVVDEDLFFKIIRASFQKRRKTMRNCLKDIIPDEKLGSIFAACGIDPMIRGEELGIPEFAKIANAYSR
jgi:16S rRNA (adenine1518-N6/adenine1519-N6)-dimethyltransferase